MHRMLLIIIYFLLFELHQGFGNFSLKNFSSSETLYFLIYYSEPDDFEPEPEPEPQPQPEPEPEPEQPEPEPEPEPEPH